MIDIEKNMYEHFLQNLKENVNFSFSRFGDGEWALILRKDPMYSQIVKRWGTSVDNAGILLKDLLLKKPNYFIGIQTLAYNTWKEDIESFLPAEVNGINSDIFHRNSIRGNLEKFISVLKKRKVILVGPSYLKDLDVFDFFHVITPELYVWDQANKIADDLRTLIHKDVVILYSCSITANALIDMFYQEYQDSITQIDTGSLWDPYVGMNSRSYHTVVINRLGISSEKIRYPKLK